jgi:hypothetical protein
MLKPNKYLDITDHEIKAKKKCTVAVNLKEYDQETILNTSTFINLPGIIDVYFPEEDDVSHIILNYAVNLMKSKNTIEEKDEIQINYEEGDTIIRQDFAESGLDMRVLIKLLQGRIKYIKDPSILLQMIHQMLPGSDLVHLELIVANMMRNDDGTVCREKGNYKNCEVLGQTNVALEDSWLSAISYRNMDTAISNALVSGKTIKRNPIEKVLNEEFSTL